VVDGGAGTPIVHHGLLPYLNSALLRTIMTFRLLTVADQFCSCTIDVNDKLSYAYVLKILLWVCVGKFLLSLKCNAALTKIFQADLATRGLINM
jgi:hypothetical protein